MGYIRISSPDCNVLALICKVHIRIPYVEELTKNKRHIFEIVFMQLRKNSTRADQAQIKNLNQRVASGKWEFTVKE